MEDITSASSIDIIAPALWSAGSSVADSALQAIA